MWVPRCDVGQRTIVAVFDITLAVKSNHCWPYLFFPSPQSPHTLSRPCFSCFEPPPADDATQRRPRASVSCAYQPPAAAERDLEECAGVLTDGKDGRRGPESAGGGGTEVARSAVHGMRPGGGEDLESDDVPWGPRRITFSSCSSPASRAAASPHSPELSATSFSRDPQPRRGGGAPAPSGAGEKQASRPVKLSLAGLSLSHRGACRTSSLFGAMIVAEEGSAAQACLGMSGVKGNEGHCGGGISIISQNFSKSP
jgi:hypothetical protein